MSAPRTPPAPPAPAAADPGAPPDPGAPLLEVRDLGVSLLLPGGACAAVEGLSFSLGAGRMAALVGESGSGKSLTALAIAGLLDPAVARVRGSVRLQGRELLGLPERALRPLRGPALGVVFQDPLASLDPAWRVGAQVAEPLRIHRGLSRAAARERAVALLREVGIPDPEARARAFPHELSGGQRQRVALAAALACDPSLLVADEPTSALDPTVQVAIVALLRRAQAARGMAVLLVTHDLALVEGACDDLLVLYAGQLAEAGPAAALLAAPRHPYTAGLLAAARLAPLPGGRLPELPGSVPDVAALPSGCRFRPRCPRADGACLEAPHPVRADGRLVACAHPLEGLAR